MLMGRSLISPFAVSLGLLCGALLLIALLDKQQVASAGHKYRELATEEEHETLVHPTENPDRATSICREAQRIEIVTSANRSLQPHELHRFLFWHECLAIGQRCAAQHLGVVCNFTTCSSIELGSDEMESPGFGPSIEVPASQHHRGRIKGPLWR